MEIIVSIDTDLSNSITEAEAIAIEQTNAQIEADKEALVLAQQAYQDKLDSITVTTSSGKVFDGRDKDQVRMTTAIEASKDLLEIENARFSAIASPTAAEITDHDTNVTNLTQTMWKMHDNTPQVVTVTELKEARALAIQALGAIILGGV